MKRTILTTLLLLMTLSFSYGKTYRVQSPNKRIEVCVNATEQQTDYSVFYDGKEIQKPSAIAMRINGGSLIFGPSKSFKAKFTSKEETVRAQTYRVGSFISRYNSMDLQASSFGIEFRAFDEGIAYRFYSKTDGELVVDSETAEFNYDEGTRAFIPYCQAYPKRDGFENTYVHSKISEFDREKTAMLPLLIDLNDGKKIAITESNLFSYPGMLLIAGSKGSSLAGSFPKYPSRIASDGIGVEETEEFIAKTSGKRTFPWRVLEIAEKDTDLPKNDMVYALADETKVGVWATPGKSTWDWWFDWSLQGVDFKPGPNTATYKYFIDFAAEYNLEYVLMDASWQKEGTMYETIPEIDLQEITRYARRKGTQIILWMYAWQFVKNADEICKHFRKMGVAGFKLDFTDRTDQAAVEMITKIAEVTAANNMIVDFHGIYKPTGLSRTYPNIVNYEGVYGMEQLKWTTPDMPSYDVTIPFIRMVAGPMDYTPGAMKNASQKLFRPSWRHPMSQGTRAHQVALYIVFDSPFTMLSDDPFNYRKESETTKYIASIPCQWDDLKILQGEVSEYIVTARRQSSYWYIGGITSWKERDIKLTFDFIEPGTSYDVQYFRDGDNANENATDYKLEKITVKYGDTLNIHMASGGGFAMKMCKN